MDNLRLILILIGLVVLALIVLFHKPAGQTQRNHARWRQAVRREPHLGEGKTDSRGGDDDRAAHWPDQSETGSGQDRHHTRPPELAGGATAEPPDKIVYLYICRRGDKRISGSELLDAAIKAGLSFGEMSIFHRRHEGATQPVFSMANLTAPGHFNPSQWNLFDTPGVTLFLTLPAPVTALDAWDAMLATAQRISGLLDADVLDDGKCLLTRQRIAQIREEMREYDRQSGMIKTE
ncbi:MAG: cell division protein ZipA [Pseudomonadota bacterium]|nr:MAG: cell division protein ZipA [Pseudomonadota bacterium]